MGYDLKLGKRLQHIAALADESYTHIWDCCCDHGYLGRALLHELHQPQIHFVDIVPELINSLELQLQQKAPRSGWHTDCMDTGEVPLDQMPGKHLVIIAGVGGDLIQEFVTRLHQQHPNADVDYLLCPVYHQYAVRQQLIDLGFRLKQEELVKDKRHFYEILKVCPGLPQNQHLPAVSSTGQRIWKADTEMQTRTAREYLSRTLAHYRRISRGNHKPVEHIIAAYADVRIETAEG